MATKQENQSQALENWASAGAVASHLLRALHTADVLSEPEAQSRIRELKATIEASRRRGLAAGREQLDLTPFDQLLNPTAPTASG